MRRHGFSMFALLIVIVVIAIIAAIAIPSLLRSRVSSNEASAIASLRTLVTSQEQYKNTDGMGSYANLAILNTAVPPFIDSVLSSGQKSGYAFVGAYDAREPSRNRIADPVREVTLDSQTGEVLSVK